MKWLIDEMLPAGVASRLAEFGHDAVSVHSVGLAGAEDKEVFRLAVSEGRVIMTENFGDYSALIEDCLSRDEPSVPVVFIHKSDFPRGGGSPRMSLSASTPGRLCTLNLISDHIGRSR